MVMIAHHLVIVGKTIKPDAMQTNYQSLLLRRTDAFYPFQSSRLRDFVDRKPKYFFFKRIFDLAFSSLVIVLVLSWVIPFLALVIKIDSSGPIFFRQKRIGKGGRIFLCIKFRTMKQNMEADVQQAVENDGRITAIGQFLRISSIDELPQFINVFFGQMSIIGPRPHMISDCIRFSEIITGYKFRNMVKPGITGLAQVKGYRGPANNDKNILRRFQYDAFYVRNSNFWLDLRILRMTLMQTIAVIFKRSFKNKSSAVQKDGKLQRIAA
jgi:putative colanic acid biosynthesis UDP-glucose lipid carrier transferase